MARGGAHPCGLFSGAPAALLLQPAAALSNSLSGVPFFLNIQTSSDVERSWFRAASWLQPKPSNKSTANCSVKGRGGVIGLGLPCAIHRGLMVCPRWSFLLPAPSENQAVVTLSKADQFQPWKNETTFRGDRSCRSWRRSCRRWWRRCRPSTRTSAAWRSTSSPRCELRPWAGLWHIDTHFASAQPHTPPR